MPSTPPPPTDHSSTAARLGVSIDDAREIAATLRRSYEAVDDSIMGFAFAREEREALVGSEAEKFLVPRPSDMRFRLV